MRVNEIQDLIKFVSKSGVSEVELETDKVKLTIKNDPAKKKGGKRVEGTDAQMMPQMQMPQMQMPMMPQQAAPIAAPAPSAPAPQPAAEAPVKETAKEDDSKYVAIKSPMIGTFYRRPSPDKDLFVNVGDEIKPGDVLCIIEAMKLFNEIESEISGKVVKILADDSTPVEYDQPLFLVDPS
jgi:acetyl-CoA carboxylase biotin carboxyl carrier protein